MLNLENYTNKLSYPKKEDFTVTYFYSAGEVICKLQPGDKAPADLGNCVKEKIVDEAAYKAAKEAYGRKDSELSEKFIVDLFKDNNAPDNEFTRALYSIAYERGHSAGYYEVESIFGDLVMLHTIANKVYG